KAAAGEKRKVAHGEGSSREIHCCLFVD
nr:hypothetical protein [Tanacetum cinerariifolium]